MVTDVSETLIQQKLNPGLCSVHPDKPLVYGEKVFLVPRGDVPAICQSLFASLMSKALHSENK